MNKLYSLGECEHVICLPNVNKGVSFCTLLCEAKKGLDFNRCLLKVLIQRKNMFYFSEEKIRKYIIKNEEM